MTESSKPAKKAKASTSKASSKSAQPLPDPNASTEAYSLMEQDHSGDVDVPNGYDYTPAPIAPQPNEQWTPYPGAWTYVWDAETKSWMCYERGYKGPVGDQGPEGIRGERGDVASVVECATPPTNATRGVFYLTNGNCLLIGI